jgi:hypothetical protein
MLSFGLLDNVLRWLAHCNKCPVGAAAAIIRTCEVSTMPVTTLISSSVTGSSKSTKSGVVAPAAPPTSHLQRPPATSGL